ncbi:MAG: class I SAM-dependent methyltransferase [Rhizobiaceae bacterium]|nr:class I SAM-dependent methyltransferase [Rhizobiaceae bacterium]
MDEDRLYSDPSLVEFYDIENSGGADFLYCRGLAEASRSVLDLGCGTGQLAAAIAEGREVVGVDPAKPMLDVARLRPGGDRVTWVEGDARSVRLGRSFDLVVLTGHAFQVFLTAEDRHAAIGTIAAHLAPGGRFVFDTRNPGREEWREWTPDASRRTVQHPELGLVEAWNDVAFDPAAAIATYETHYRLPDGRSLSAQSKIAFPPKTDVEAAIRDAGLVVDRWMGDWSGGAWRADAPEIIPFGRRVT